MSDLVTLIIALLDRPEIKEIDNGQVCSLIKMIIREIEDNDYDR